ncbi:Uncharacterized protein Fot_02500 [Forsythia ovata]|uniref:Uncharacterized protein n=1 Tax=Forsythia ovata TaxID=205694 RepID=A0ABD1X712_9LAMI
MEVEADEQVHWSAPNSTVDRNMPCQSRPHFHRPIMPLGTQTGVWTTPTYKAGSSKTWLAVLRSKTLGLGRSLSQCLFGRGRANQVVREANDVIKIWDRVPRIVDQGQSPEYAWRGLHKVWRRSSLVDKHWVMSQMYYATNLVASTNHNKVPK